MKNILYRIRILSFFSIIIFTFIITALINSCTEQVSVSPPDEPPPNGTLFIDSNPRGAHIYLDGKDRRRITPDSLTWLETNNYSVALKLDLYRDTSITTSVVEGEKSEYFVDYTKNPLMRGKINCNAKPYGSSIFINGQPTGKVTPSILTDLLPGYYTIRFEQNNYRDDSVTVVVRSSYTVEAKTTLVDTTVWANFSTQTSSIPTNYLTCIIKDKNGVLWIGTEDKGLLKFDGNTWVTFTPGNSLLQDVRVSSFSFDSDGVLWVGNKYGLFLLGDNFSRKYNDPFNHPLTDSDVKAIATFNDSLVYIATNITTVYSAIDYYGYRFWVIKTRNQYGLPNDYFTSAAIDKNGTLYTGTSLSGMIIGGSQLLNTSNSNILGNKVSAITADPISGVWIGFKSGIAAGTGISYYNGTFQSKYVLQSNNNTNSIYVDDNNVKWVGTDAGLVEFTTEADIKTYNKESTGLNMNDVRGVVNDNIGRIWIATYGGGLILKKK
jgi:ligand-binding sensor domain-containing protein